MKILLIFLIITIKIKKLKSHSKIYKFPFKREIPKEITSSNIFDFINENNIQTEIEISNNQHYKIPLNIKLRQYPFFFTSPDAYPDKITYKFTESTSFLGDSTKYNFHSYDFQNGFIGNDTIFIDNEKIFQFNFFIGTKLANNIKESGSIGLNIYNPEQKFSEINFLYQLKNRNLILNYEFTFKYDNNDNGELIIGDKPHNYDNNYKEENYKILNLSLSSSNKSYDIDINNITYGDVNISEKIICELLIESGVIIGNEKYRNEVKKDFFNLHLYNGDCNEKTIESKQLYYYNCKKNVNISKMKNIKFYIENINFSLELSYEDLFYEYNNIYYFLVIFNYRDFYNFKWKLGKPLFKKYQFVFDQGNKKIGFYTKFNKPDKNKNYIIIGFAITIIIVIIILIIISSKTCKCKKKRKMRHNEIKEEYYKGNDNQKKENLLGI